MTFEFYPTKSKQSFVGRNEERKIFNQILLEPQSIQKWIILIPGSGGVGKTRLLETLRDDALSQSDVNVLVTDTLIDFYKTANQTDFGLLQTIVQQLGPQYFEQFFAEREVFDRSLISDTEPELRQERATQVFEAFLRDYSKLLKDGYKIILLFDTCEEIRAAENFLMGTLIPRIGQLEETLFKESAHDDDILQRQTITVIAGRRRLNFPNELADQVITWNLSPLTLDQTKEFFVNLGSSSLADEQIKQLYDLTGGHPLYVALSYDWLKNEVGTWDELLSLDDPLGEKLVGWIRRLDTDEKRAILYTAIAWRRVEPSLLAKLLGIVEEDSKKLIERLSQFSFVKYRPPSEGFRGSFQLHDEMRDHVLTYVTLQEGKESQNLLTHQIADWYEKRISDADMLSGVKLPSQGDLPIDEMRSLIAEWLFYQCELDLDNGFEIQEKLFRNAIHYLDLDFADLLNQEVERFETRLTKQQKGTLRFREALVASRREDFERAGFIWHSLLRQDALNQKMRATTLMLLVELDAYMGDPDEAFEHAEESEEIYDNLLEEEPDPERSQLFINEKGQLYNNWGFACRVKGNLDSALKYYELALEVGGKKKNIARTLNNMGYVYLNLGDIVQARTFVGRALQIRRGLNLPYELGLGHNTMGIIMEQSGRVENATDSYYKALRSFDAARSERGKALVLLNLGRIERTVNRFAQAIEYLDKATNVFERKGDIDNLITTLNELGCVYRSRGDTGDYKKAEALFQKSLDYCKEIETRTYEETDNWVDLSILYWYMFEEVQKINLEEANEYAKATRNAASRAEEIAKKYGYTYLLAKNDRTLGDLAYAEKSFNDAFEHYYDACLLMAEAKKEGHLAPLLRQRRFEQMVDRLQEQLQALPTEKDTLIYTNAMLKKLADQEKNVENELMMLRDFLQAAKNMVEKTPNIGE